MRALVFAAAFALIGSAAGAQTMNTMETMTTPTATATTTTKTTTTTHTMPARSMMSHKRHAMRLCTTKMRNGHKMRTCKKTMMRNKMGTMPKM